MQPYRHSDIEKVKLRTPINWGPTKRIGQALLVIAPTAIIGILALIINPVIAVGILIYLVCCFFASGLMSMDDFFQGDKSITIALKVAWWPVFLCIAVVRLIIGLAYAIRGFGRWIIRG